MKRETIKSQNAPDAEAPRTEKPLRAAVYCRVAADGEDGLTLDAQREHYTEKIRQNPDWTMAGIFADEGIFGPSMRKRPAFQRMLRRCKEGKIDIVLTKSISRFARNAASCLEHVRVLKELGIAVIFETEGINTLDYDSEALLLTMICGLAKAESQSMTSLCTCRFCRPQRR